MDHRTLRHFVALALLVTASLVAQSEAPPPRSLTGDHIADEPHQEEHSLVLTVGSGSYRFVVDR